MRVVAALLCLALVGTSASASLDSGRSRLVFAPGPLASWNLANMLSSRQVPVAPPAEAVMTKNTRVFLDGVACDFGKVPATAQVLRMELDSDGRTILRIEFRSK